MKLKTFIARKAPPPPPTGFPGCFGLVTITVARSSVKDKPEKFAQTTKHPLAFLGQHWICFLVPVYIVAVVVLYKMNVYAIHPHLQGLATEIKDRRLPCRLLLTGSITTGTDPATSSMSSSRQTLFEWVEYRGPWDR